MAEKIKMNPFFVLIAPLRWLLFWIVALAQFPILFLIPRGPMSVRYSRFFYWILMEIGEVRGKLRGTLSKERPLLLVSNHISIFELAIYPVLGLGSFFGKKEIAKYPLIGWFAKKFGVVFIDRDPRKAKSELAKINAEMKVAKDPMTIFPEGTTNNGCFVYPFKSAMFDVVDKIDGLTVQPVVLVYRDRKGRRIGSDYIMANNYSCPANAKIAAYNQSSGKNEIIPNKEFSTMGHFYHIMKLGGIRLEVNLLPPVPVAGMDRKKIAETLHKIISDKYMELKNESNM
ncbi:MAG: 1-acyl-sn-glycerol-3-phosphate acyltransferase [Rickettsiales bacterium]|jgi:1-acyl-sn-glycerol-3-phosphate acyltransferase|nr:1-acyl-sn-glycerol-3-phosphate acyltransferase [Rickettsiales bacterium]